MSSVVVSAAGTPGILSARGTEPDLGRISDRHAETRYWAAINELLDDAISNRVNLDIALASSRSAAESLESFDEFRGRQLGLLVSLARLHRPARLISFHERLRQAAINQVVFYAAVVEAKLQEGAVRADEMLAHPALRAVSDELDAARDHMHRLAPPLDPRTEAEIEGRLIWLAAI